MFASKLPYHLFPQFDELQYWLAGETNFFVTFEWKHHDVLVNVTSHSRVYVSTITLLLKVSYRANATCFDYRLVIFRPIFVN